MIFEEYETCKMRFEKVKNQYDKILREKEELFCKTQPKGIRYDKERVDSSCGKNAMSEYVIALEVKKINPRLKEAKEIMQARKLMLDRLYVQLNNSKETEDIIYRLRYIEKLNAEEIGQILNYSKAGVYKILERIKKSVYKSRQK